MVALHQRRLQITLNHNISNQLKFLVFGKRGKPVQGKTPQSKVENPQPQPKCGVKDGIANLLESECSHDCADSAFNKIFQFPLTNSGSSTLC